MTNLNGFIEFIRAFTATHIETVISIMVASANIILAALTWSMARATRHMALETRDSVAVSRSIADTSVEQVTLSREQYNLSRQALLSSIQPLLLSSPEQLPEFDQAKDDWRGISVTLTRTHVHAALSFVNAGVGVALVESAHARFGDLTPAAAKSIIPRVVKPDEAVRVGFVIPVASGASPIDRQLRDIEVEVRYGNILGSYTMTSTAYLDPAAHNSGTGTYAVSELILRGLDTPEFRFELGVPSAQS